MLFHDYARAFVRRATEMLNPFVHQRANSFQEFDSRLAEVLGDPFGGPYQPEEPPHRVTGFTTNTLTAGLLLCVV